MYARGLGFKPWLFQSFELDFKLRSRLHMTLAVNLSIKQKITSFMENHSEFHVSLLMLAISRHCLLIRTGIATFGGNMP